MNAIQGPGDGIHRNMQSKLHDYNRYTQIMVSCQKQTITTKQLCAQRVIARRTKQLAGDDERRSNVHFQWNQFETFTSLKINYESDFKYLIECVLDTINHGAHIFITIHTSYIHATVQHTIGYFHTNEHWTSYIVDGRQRTWPRAATNSRRISS